MSVFITIIPKLSEMFMENAKKETLIEELRIIDRVRKQKNLCLREKVI